MRLGRGGLVAFPFPVRPGRMAYLNLPPDMTPEEAGRVAACVRTLAIREDGEERESLVGPLLTAGQLAELRRHDPWTAEDRAAILRQIETLEAVIANQNTLLRWWERGEEMSAALPWRQGESVPENLYDATPAPVGAGGKAGRPVGVMRSPGLAARVVAAVNDVARYRAALAEIRDTQGADQALGPHQPDGGEATTE